MATLLRACKPRIHNTVEPGCNEDPVITENIWKPGRITVKLICGNEPRYNEPRYNEYILTVPTHNLPRCNEYFVRSRAAVRVKLNDKVFLN